MHSAPSYSTFCPPRSLLSSFFATRKFSGLVVVLKITSRRRRLPCSKISLSMAPEKGGTKRGSRTKAAARGSEVNEAPVRARRSPRQERETLPEEDANLTHDEGDVDLNVTIPKKTRGRPKKSEGSAVTKKATEGGVVKKRKSHSKFSQNYNNAIYKVLKQIYPTLGIGAKGMQVMSSFTQDVFNRLAKEAGQLVKIRGVGTLTAREMEAATRLILTDQLREHAQLEGAKAIARYSKNTGGNRAKAVQENVPSGKKKTAGEQKEDAGEASEAADMAE